MIVNQGEQARGQRWEKKNLVSFAADFLKHLTAGLLPVDVIIADEHRRDLSYTVGKKGDGWVVTLINYSYERGPAQVIKYGTAQVDVKYPPREVPVRLVCRFPVGDALEWIEDRDLEWTLRDGQAVIETTVASGEIKVIELQPQSIKLAPVPRPVNFALNRPVKVTSAAKGHRGEQLVDGDRSRDNGWWSGDFKRKGRTFTLPQSAVVCLEQKRQIDHIDVLLYHWERERPEKFSRPRYTQFLVETSTDGDNWELAFDERQSRKTAYGDPLVRWFEPRTALYVRLTVTHNSMGDGAQVVEMGVYGSETEPVPIRRKPAEPGRIRFPIDLSMVASERVVHLMDLKYESARSDWLPVGKTIDDMCGGITLRATQTDQGKFFPKSLYAQSNAEYVYRLDGKYQYFLCVIGFGLIQPDGCTVVFRVELDDEEVFNSGVFKKGRYPEAVFLDVSGKQTLRLIVDDAGDWIRNDYAWWAEPRLLKAE